MSLTHAQIRKSYKDFWQSHNHKEVPPIPLIPQNDPTTLFTGSGMQQFVPNLLGEPHPQGNRLFNIQPCFRAQDIEEIGDNRHTTCFEMMGNWSLGDYFKKEQLSWLFEFLVEVIKLPPQKLFVTVFKGYGSLPADTESIEIWKKIFAKYDIKAEIGECIFLYGAEKNWWSRAGVPENMPAGEPGGPDSEIFFKFDIDHNPSYGENCHPNCDCGRFMEIGNSVFMEYKKTTDGSFSILPKKNVDFGGGFERFVSASNNNPDMFETDLYAQSIKMIEDLSGKNYSDPNYKAPMRIIADHLKAATVMIVSGVTPSNKQQGYVLRRLLRRSAVKIHALTQSPVNGQALSEICDKIMLTYDGELYIERAKHKNLVFSVVSEEISRFNSTLSKGLKEINKIDTIDGKKAFDLYQTYGFPLEITEELFREKGQNIDKKQFQSEFEKHKNLSRTSSAGMFKGGLADHSDQVLKYHTATHLIHQALFEVVGNDIRQEGSNITGERLRFDFYSANKPEKSQMQSVSDIVNSKIKESLPMRFKIMPREEALKIGARAFFKEKYPENVKVYYIGGIDDKPETAYSKEFCGGPHVKNTSDISKIEIYKFEKIGSNLYRIYAK